MFHLFLIEVYSLYSCMVFLKSEGMRREEEV